MARKRPPPRWLEARRHGGPGEGTWLSRALARAGVLPLAAAEDAIRAGRVRLDGRVAHEPFAPLGPGARVQLDGIERSLAWRTRVLAFHKPAGVVTHGTDPHGVGTVFDALARVLSTELSSFGWHAVGRLDRDTTGLLLFTNDERFVAHATSPQTHLPKRYRATVGAAVTEAQLESLRRGVQLEDGVTRPSQARCLGPSVVELILTEGRYHQVKRMLGAVGLPTLALHRQAVGGLELDVEMGAVREVSEGELITRLRFQPRSGGP